MSVYPNIWSASLECKTSLFWSQAILVCFLLRIYNSILKSEVKTHAKFIIVSFRQLWHRSSSNDLNKTNQHTWDLYWHSKLTEEHHWINTTLSLTVSPPLGGTRLYWFENTMCCQRYVYRFCLRVCISITAVKTSMGSLAGPVMNMLLCRPRPKVISEVMACLINNLDIFWVDSPTMCNSIPQLAKRAEFKYCSYWFVNNLSWFGAIMNTNSFPDTFLGFLILLIMSGKLYDSSFYILTHVGWLI